MSARAALALFASAAGLIGFSSPAGASATVDLVWIDKTDPSCLDAARRDCPQIGPIMTSDVVSDQITLAVLITAGSNGVLAAGVSVDYSDALPILDVSGFSSLTTPPFLTFHLGATTDQLAFIDHINAVAVPYDSNGIGLPPGRSAYLGTVSFHKSMLFNGIFEIAVGINGPSNTDDVIDLAGHGIAATSTFNSAHLIIVHEPPGQDLCNFRLEINALRTSGKKVRAGTGRSVDVTAKARIIKGTAPVDATVEAVLTIEARDGGAVIGANSTAPDTVLLEVGKSGTGEKLAVDVPTCDSGFIDFTAEFLGLDPDGDVCRATRSLRRECQ